MRSSQNSIEAKLDVFTNSHQQIRLIRDKINQFNKANKQLQHHDIRMAITSYFVTTAIIEALNNSNYLSITIMFPVAVMLFQDLYKERNEKMQAQQMLLIELLGLYQWCTKEKAVSTQLRIVVDLLDTIAHFIEDTNELLHWDNPENPQSLPAREFCRILEKAPHNIKFKTVEDESILRKVRFSGIDTPRETKKMLITESKSIKIKHKSLTKMRNFMGDAVTELNKYATSAGTEVKKAVTSTAAEVMLVFYGLPAKDDSSEPQLSATTNSSVIPLSTSIGSLVWEPIPGYSTQHSNLLSHSRFTISAQSNSQSKPSKSGMANLTSASQDFLTQTRELHQQLRNRSGNFTR